MGIIDRFQVIHIAEEQQHASLYPVCEFHGLFCQEDETTPVVQPGQLIG